MSNHYIQLPDVTNKTNMDLHGSYVYLQLKTIGARFFILHMDLRLSDNTSLRVSVSNMYRQPKVAGRTVQLPAHFPADRWTVVCIHFPTVIGLFTSLAPHAHHLRRVQVCFFFARIA